MACSTSYPSPDSDRGSSAGSPSTATETSLVIKRERDSTSCEPEPVKAQVRGERRRKPHSVETWEAVKPIIARLYLQDNWRLKDVMAILEERGFCASTKMYKTKLTQWKFFKNNRKTDVANILYLQRYRRALGKESTFRRNGRKVDVDAYIRRKGIQPADLLKVARPGDLPCTLRCRTPPPPSLPTLVFRKIDAPDDLFLQEVYQQWSMESRVMPPQLNTYYLQELDQYHQSDAMNSVKYLTHGCWLLSIGKVREGGAFCRLAFSSIDSVLKVSAHFAIYELLSSASRYPDLNIQRALWGYLSDFAAKLGSVDEKLRRVLSAFAKLARDHSAEHNVEMIQWGRRFASRQSNGSFDGAPFDYTLIQPWDMLPVSRSYQHRYYLSQTPWEVDTIPSATIYTPDGEKDPWDLRADLLIMLGNKTGWTDDRISSIALKMLDQMPPENPPRYLKFVCLYALARNNRARYRGGTVQSSTDHKLAREYLKQAVEGE
ncbi:Clr5 domain-containing protein [Xylaria intraflava]|nr:Clr5 domain-containing protein [Xylaria intraflava]